MAWIRIFLDWFGPLFLHMNFLSLFPSYVKNMIWMCMLSIYVYVVYVCISYAVCILYVVCVCVCCLCMLYVCILYVYVPLVLDIAFWNVCRFKHINSVHDKGRSFIFSSSAPSVYWKFSVWSSFPYCLDLFPGFAFYANLLQMIFFL